jgi:CRP/FNR family cyclic AMP-dependent transcriptional regulator
MTLRPEHARLLSGLPAPLSTKLFANTKLVRLTSGEILFRAGASDDGCYRVEEGLLKVTIVSGSGAERILTFLGPGAIVGELSIIDGQPRSATVVAVRDAKVSFLSRANFEAFAEKHSEVYKSLVRLLAQRLRETDSVIAAAAFCRSRAGSRGRCSSWRDISGKKSRRAGSSSVRRSDRTI